MTPSRFNSAIQRHYDKAGRRDEMENRRRSQLDKLSLDNEEDEADG